MATPHRLNTWTALRRSVSSSVRTSLCLSSLLWATMSVLPLIGLLLALLLPLPARAADAELPDRGGPLLLHASEGSRDLWPRARILADPDGKLTAEQALQRRSDFTPAGRLGANLGKRQGAVWVHVPVQVSAPVPTEGAPLPSTLNAWVLDVDYPSLDSIDVYLIDGPQILVRASLGDHVPVAQRPSPSRSHTLTLDLPSGQPRELLVRLQTTGSMLAPMRLYTPASYALAESREQALQGLFAGAGLCLLLYSLTQWASLRESMFGWYALTLGGTTAFFAALSGFGVQHLWGGSDWLTQNGPPFFILLGVGGAFFFVLQALEIDKLSPRIARVVRACGVLAATAALLFLLGVLDYSSTQAIGMALGPTPMLLVLPTAFKRLRAGDHTARWVLLGWGVYSIGVLVLLGVLRGLLPINFTTLHAFQFASLVEMSMWMAVLGERVQVIRLQAAAVQQQHDDLQSLAQTDALTGLLNRRGLQAAIQPRLAGCSTQKPLAVFLVDLDGFKAINDSLGHEAGDAVLVEVARRLQGNLRSTDLVCRLGGDEFVLVTGFVARDPDTEAQIIGAKLLKAFEQPIQLGAHLCRVGLTIGYATAPADDTSLDKLLKRADAAMYAGKQAGRGCLRRSGPVAAVASH